MTMVKKYLKLNRASILLPFLILSTFFHSWHRFKWLRELMKTICKNTEGEKNKRKKIAQEIT